MVAALGRDKLLRVGAAYKRLRQTRNGVSPARDGSPRGLVVCPRQLIDFFSPIKRVDEAWSLVDAVLVRRISAIIFIS